MKKQFIPFYLCLKFRELGFDEPCFTYYFTDGVLSDAIEDTEEAIYPGDGKFLESVNSDNLGISALLYQQAFDFLREKRNLHIEFEFIDQILGYKFILTNVKTNTVLSEPSTCYKEFTDVKIASLDRVIEIIKEQNLKPKQP